MIGKSTVRKDGKVLRVGSDPNIESNWEVCTITERACPRHIHSLPKGASLNLDLTDESSDSVSTTDYENTTEDPKAKVEALMKAIEDGVENVIDSGEIENFLAHMGKFHNYSFGNQMLIYIQKPEATQVAGYNSWEEQGRQVKKGETGIVILAPVMIKKKKTNELGIEEEDTVRIGFRDVRVFDVSQTEPALYEFKNEEELAAFTKEWTDKGYEVTIDSEKPHAARITKTPSSPAKLLEGQAPPQMKNFVLERIASEGVEIQYGNVGGGANGASWKDSTTGAIRISVRDDVSEAQQIKTLTHELMHVKLGHLDRMDEYHSKDGGHRGEMEVAVEALSFMVGNHFGLDTGDYSHGYMAGWARSNKGKLKEVLEKDVMGFFKEFMSELPKIEEEHPPMGTAATRRREMKSKRVSNKKSWRSKKR